MLTDYMTRNAKVHHQIRWLLVLLLIFAAMHVALHDLDSGATDNEHQGECQVCRLNHVPVASLSVPELYAPLQLLVYLQPVIDTACICSYPPHHHQARAPPPLI